MKTLKKRLNEGIASVYVIQGDDFYLFDKALNMIKNACKITLDDFNVSNFDSENFSLEKIFEATEMLPMIDSKRLVVLNGGTIKDSEKKRLEQILLKIPKTTCVVVLDYNKNFDFLKKTFTFVDANRLDRETVKKLVKTYLMRENKDISVDALDALIDSTNCYLTRIMTELSKLICYDLENQLITKNMVDDMVVKDVEYSVFELTEALSKKDGDKALKLLSFMDKDSGVFSLMSNHFRRLFYSSISDLNNGEISKLLGVKEYAILKARQLAKGFSKAQLKRINKFFEEYDYMVKSGKMLLSNALYLLVFNIIYV